MLIDGQNSFSTVTNGAIVGDSPTSSSGATASSNVIDLGVARDIGGAVTDDLYLLCEVIAAFTSGGAGTLQVALEGSNDNSSFAIIEQSDAIALASLIKGYKFLPGRMVSPQSNGAYRYLRLLYTIGTADMTAGTLVAALVPALQHSPAYGRGYTA